MKGCIVAAAEGDRAGRRRARASSGTLLLAHHGDRGLPSPPRRVDASVTVGD